MDNTKLALCIHRHAARSPAAPALWWHGEPVSYRHLFATAERQGSELRRWPGGPVCVAAHASPSSIAAALGAMGAGRGVLFHAPALPAPDAARIAAAAGSTVGWREGEGWGSIASSSAARPEAPSRPASPPEPGFLAFVDGQAPGAASASFLEVAVIGRQADTAREALGMGPGVCVLGHAPLCSQASLLELWAPLMAGASVALVDRTGSVDPRRLQSLISHHAVQLVLGPPALYEVMTRTLRNAALPSVEKLVVAGGGLRPECRARLPQLFPSARPFSLEPRNVGAGWAVHEIPTELRACPGRPARG